MNTKEKVEYIEFSQMGDERGHLVIVEGNTNVPFEIKRVFYIYGSDGAIIRGQHANRRTKFVLINVAGTSKVKIIDEHGEEFIYKLTKPHTGIYLPTMIWKEMYDFSEDSVLLVLASEHYDPAEYIRNFEDYANEKKSNL